MKNTLHNAVLFTLNNNNNPEAQIQEFKDNGLTGDWYAQQDVQFVGLVHEGVIHAVGEVATITKASETRNLYKCKNVRSIDQLSPFDSTRNPVHYADFNPNTNRFS